MNNQNFQAISHSGRAQWSSDRCWLVFPEVEFSWDFHLRSWLNHFIGLTGQPGHRLDPRRPWSAVRPKEFDDESLRGPRCCSTGQRCRCIQLRYQYNFWLCFRLYSFSSYSILVFLILFSSFLFLSYELPAAHDSAWFFRAFWDKEMIRH